MKVAEGYFIVPYQDEEHGTLGMRIAWDGALDRRKLKRMVYTSFKYFTGRSLNPKQMNFFLRNLIRHG